MLCIFPAVFLLLKNGYKRWRCWEMIMRNNFLKELLLSFVFRKCTKNCRVRGKQNMWRCYSCCLHFCYKTIAQCELVDHYSEFTQCIINTKKRIFLYSCLIFIFDLQVNFYANVCSSTYTKFSFMNWYWEFIATDNNKIRIQKFLNEIYDLTKELIRQLACNQQVLAKNYVPSLFHTSSIGSPCLSLVIKGSAKRPSIQKATQFVSAPNGNKLAKFLCSEKKLSYSFGLGLCVARLKCFSNCRALNGPQSLDNVVKRNSPREID